MEQSDESVSSAASTLATTAHGHSTMATTLGHNNTTHNSIAAPHNHSTASHNVSHSYKNESHNVSQRDPSKSEPPANLNIASDFKKMHLTSREAIPDVPVPAASRPASCAAGELANMTCHEIDISCYVAPDENEEMTAQLNMSIAIDPHDPFDEALIKKFLARLPEPISSHPSYHTISGPMPKFAANSDVMLGNYTTNDNSGTGCFAT